MDITYLKVKDVLEGDIPFLLHDFDQLLEFGKLRGQLPKISALRVVCTELGLPRNWEEMTTLCAEAAMPLVFERRFLGAFGTWLFVSHGSWLADNRIVRYKKLWSQIEGNYEFESHRRGPEVAFKYEQEIRYATVAQLTPENFVEGMRILRRRGSSAVIVTPRDDMDSDKQVRALFEAAFPPRKGRPDLQTDWLSLVSRYCAAGNILVRASGDWDERECSLDFLGEAQRIDLLEKGLGSG